MLKYEIKKLYYLIIFIVLIGLMIQYPKLISLFYLISIAIIFFISKKIIVFLHTIFFNPIKFDTLAKVIPSLYIKKNIIVNNNGTYSSIIHVKGYAYSSSNQINQSKINNYQIRQRAFNITDNKDNVQIKLLFKRFKNEDGYRNFNYIEITTHDEELTNKVTSQLQANLQEFEVGILEDLELQDFLFFNINLINRKTKTLYSEKDNNHVTLNDICSCSEIKANQETGNGEIDNSHLKKVFAIYSLSFGKEIQLEYFHELSSKNIEFEYIFNSLFIPNHNAKNMLNKEYKNILISENNKKLPSSELKKEEIFVAHECIINNEDTLSMGDIYIVLYANTDEELKISVNELNMLCTKFDIWLVKETSLILYFYLQRITGFRFNSITKFILPYSNITNYAKKTLSTTFAGSFDFIKTPEGLNKCDWGSSPVCVLNTNYNNAYNFYFHISEEKAEVGHGLIVAPTGAGKTTFMQYLIKGTLEAYKDVDIYSFDRFNGMKIFTYWQQGKNISFDTSQINPLQIDLSQPENRDFLQNFLSILANDNAKEDNFNKEIEALLFAINKIPVEKRTFSYLHQTKVISNNMYNYLYEWIEGRYSQYFNAPKDSFEFNNRLITFQMEKILEDPNLAAPITYYIMFKIRQKAKKEGRGHFIFIDEAAGMFRNHNFKTQIEIMLLEHRKLRGCVWLAFQSCNTFLNDETIKEAIIGSCQNKMIFSNNILTQKTFSDLDIDRDIYNQVEKTKKINKDLYYVLLKRPNENVILNINLKKKNEPLLLYSSTTVNINLVEQLIKEDPTNWIEKYLATDKPQKIILSNDIKNALLQKEIKELLETKDKLIQAKLKELEDKQKETTDKEALNAESQEYAMEEFVLNEDEIEYIDEFDD